MRFQGLSTRAQLNLKDLGKGSCLRNMNLWRGRPVCVVGWDSNSGDFLQGQSLLADPASLNPASYLLLLDAKTTRLLQARPVARVQARAACPS